MVNTTFLALVALFAGIIYVANSYYKDNNEV